MITIALTFTVKAQESLTYQTPSQSIVELVDAPNVSDIKLNPLQTWMVVLNKPRYIDIDRAAKPIKGLAGLSVDTALRTIITKNNESDPYTSIKLTNLTSGSDVSLSGMPNELRLDNLTWHLDGQRFVYTNETQNGLELWYADLNSLSTKKLNIDRLNVITGKPIQWVSGEDCLLVQVPAWDKKPAPIATPIARGPIIQENMGKRTRAQTYQNLLSNTHDEALFDYYAESQLIKVYLDGRTEKFGEPGIFTTNTFSPDRKYILIQRIQKPYSYSVGLSYFSQTTEIWDQSGTKVTTLHERPLIENTASNINYERKHQWRKGKPHELVWVKRIPKNKKYRDEILSLSAPFDGTPQVLYRTNLSYKDIVWGNDHFAVVKEQQTSQRKLKWSLINPTNGELIKVIEERSSEDGYRDPGNFVISKGKMLISGDQSPVVYTISEGASPEGERPFLLRWDLMKDKRDTIFKSKANHYEKPIHFDGKKTLYFTRESRNVPPNMIRKDIQSNAETVLTAFESLYPSLASTQKRLISYRREDGVNLSGILHLPEGFEPKKDAPLPVLVWAYPREYLSKETAGQVRVTPHRFTEIAFRSPVYWVTRGYAVVESAAMPVVKREKDRPNDNFVEEITLNAKALIDYLVEEGIGDRKRFGVGGHSYGAFMTANLLAHTDLFAAGIARSGAYNRTLTPFGFQNETRIYWQAKDVYDHISPFNYADQIKRPLLITHGIDDENMGTHPIQSERLYAAIKGHGGTARLVMFPYEYHGFRARESILHILWEQDRWLEKYVKNRKD